jgi:hypothetical protein
MSLGLFKDKFNGSHYITYNDRIMVNKEMERICKEAVVVYFHELSCLEGLRKMLTMTAVIRAEIQT